MSTVSPTMTVGEIVVRFPAVAPRTISGSTR